MATLAAPPSRKEATAFLKRRLMTLEKPALLGNVGLRVLSGGLGIAQAALLLQMILLMKDGAAQGAYLLPASLFLGAVVARALTTKAADLVGARSSARFRTALRTELYQKFLALGPIHLARLGETGALTTALVDEIEAFDGFVARYLPLSYTAMLLPLIIAGVVLALSLPAGLVLVGAGVVLPILLAVVGIFAAKASLRQFASLRRLGGAFFDKLSHLPLLRAYGAEGLALSHLEAQADDLRLRTMRVLRRAFLSTIVMELVSLLSFAVVAGLVMHSSTPSVSALLVVLLVPEFFAPLRQMAASYHDRAIALGAAPHVMQLLAEDAPALRPLQAEVPLKAPALRFMNVSYTYPTRTKPALHNFSMRFAGGAFTALKGESGAGKSTLLHLLAGFLSPQSGQVLANEQPLSAGQIGWLGQKAYLFHGTIRSNLCLGQGDLPDDVLWAALAQVNLQDVVAALPKGLDAEVGARGYGLSGGQARRLALARTVLQKAPILLLDEPTSGLDAKASAEVVAALKKVTAGRTVVMVSHDATALALADTQIDLTGAASHA